MTLTTQKWGNIVTPDNPVLTKPRPPAGDVERDWR
jgi:hypothetical protein